MKNLIYSISVALISVFIVGCSFNNLSSSCPQFGKYCTKIPINNWDNRSVI